MGYDIAIVETGNGGDFTMQGNDLEVCLNDENEIYLRMFGGNVEQDTKNARTANENDFSYWGNLLLFGNDQQISFNSITERTLNTTSLTSQGRSVIENAIKKDLQGLNVDVSVSIIDTDKVEVTIYNKLLKGQIIKKITFTKNPLTGDFDLGDFSSDDFF